MLARHRSFPARARPGRSGPAGRAARRAVAPGGRGRRAGGRGRRGGGGAGRAGGGAGRAAGSAQPPVAAVRPAARPNWVHLGKPGAKTGPAASGLHPVSPPAPN